MKRALLLLLFLIGVGRTLYSQQKDSILFIEAKWETTRLDNGIVLRQAHFTDSSLFESNQYISILEMPNRGELSFHVVADTILRPTTIMAAENNALAAVNGSFFRYNLPYNSVDYIRINRTRLAPNTYEEGGKRLFHQLGAVVVNGGKLTVGKADISNDLWEGSVDADDILTSGPLLIFSGKREEMKNESFYTLRHPRSAVASKGDSLVFLVTVDGRAAQAAGMSLKELQSILSWLGADNALNLDGGGSTTMYIRDKGVVNHPTDNKQFDHQGERKVANCIIVCLRAR